MLRSGQVVVLCVLALLTLGVVMVNSAGMSVDPGQAVTVESILLSRSTIYMALAMVAMGACAMLPVRRIVPASWLAEAGSTPPETGPDGLLVSGEFAKGLFRTLLGLWPMWVLVAALLATLATVYLPGIGRTVNGSSRWISLPAPGLESIQPSELAKWAMVSILAWYGAANMHRMHKFWRGLLPGLAAGGVLAGFIVLEDLGTGVLLGLVACVMLIAAGARVWQLVVLAPAPLTLVAVAISSSQYRRDRLLAFLDPYADADGIGYHMIQSMVAVANGQVAGRGLGHGLQKFGYLPEDRTDFLFAIICEELGVAGALVVVALYGGMLWACWSIIRRERAAMLKLLGLGVVATVGIQALINLAVVTGLGPTKGIALPLLSSGGTGWILTAASLGLIVAMDRTQDGWSPAITSKHNSGLDSTEPEEPSDGTQGALQPEHPVAAGPSTPDEHARWAPPDLFTAGTLADTPDLHTEETPLEIAPAVNATESQATASAQPTGESRQGFLFAAEPDTASADAPPTDEPKSDQSDEAVALAESGLVLPVGDAPMIEPSGPLARVEPQPVVDLITTVHGPAEQLVISLADAPPQPAGGEAGASLNNGADLLQRGV